MFAPRRIGSSSCSGEAARTLRSSSAPGGRSSTRSSARTAAPMRRSSCVTAISTSSRPRRSTSGRAIRSRRRFATAGSTRAEWPTTRASCGRSCGAALDLSAAGELPVDVRFLLDCEEEIGGTSIIGHLEETAGPARACVIFDTAMLDDETPVLTIATRGTLYLHVEVRTGERDLHSGAYGGAALNALHVLVSVLARVLPHDGRLPETFRAGVAKPAAAELAAWEQLPRGAQQLAAQGAVPADEAAGTSSTSARGDCLRSTSTGSKAARPSCSARSSRRPRGRTCR